MYNIKYKETENMKIDQMRKSHLSLLRIPSGKKNRIRGKEIVVKNFYYLRHESSN